MNLSRDQWLQGWQKLSLFTAIVLIGCALLLWQTQRYQTAQSVLYLDVLSQQLADTLQPMLLGKDHLAIQRSLDELVDQRTVTGIRVVDALGAPVAAAGQASNTRTLSQVVPITFEQQTLASLELHTQRGSGQWPWLSLLLLAAGIGGLLSLCWQGWQSLKTLPFPAIDIPDEPETGLQWPDWLDAPQPQTVLCIAMANYSSLHNSLSAPLLNRHIVDSLDLLETLPGNALAPIQALGNGRFALVFATLKEATGAARRLALELPPLNKQRKQEGLLALRLQACVFTEADDSSMVTPEHRWLAAQQQAQSLLDLGSLCDEDDILVESQTADALRTLYPSEPLLPVKGDHGQARAWRWQPASGLDLDAVDLLEPTR